MVGGILQIAGLVALLAIACELLVRGTAPRPPLETAPTGLDLVDPRVSIGAEVERLRRQGAL
jgi:hypothetical protein